MTMIIRLATEPATQQWGKSAILSFTTENALVHLKQQNDYKTIQQAARKLRGQGIDDVELVGEWDVEQCWAFYQGFYSPKNTYAIEFPSLDADDEAELYERIRCSDFVREIINLPSDVITPVELAQRAATFICEQAENYTNKDAVSYKIITGQELEQQGYSGIWTVGKGSQNPPAMLQLDFNPSGDPNAPVRACLVGKGITFDTGGYSLKPSEYMDSMRSDMGGSALVTGALGFAIARGLQQRVKLYLCCAENMVSHNAFKLGDIITYRNGVTAEVLNTDAEGRLVLADGLIEASAQKPQFILDCATLTGAAKAAVGNDYHAVLSIDDQLVNVLFKAAKTENEAFWRLPFEHFHREQIKSSFADIANTATISTPAGASTATAFLSYFVENYQQNWLHIDCSATFRKSANSLWSIGATGIGIRTLANLLFTA